MRADYINKLSKVAELMDELRQPASMATPGDRANHLKFTAGLRYFHRHRSQQAARETYLESIENHRLRNLEFEHAHLLEEIDVLTVRGGEKIDPSRPAIYYSFHLGSYFLCPLAVAGRGVDMTLCFGPDRFEAQEAEILDMVAKCRARSRRYDVGFDTINVGRKSATMSMLAHVEQGKSLFFYIDGNSGSDAALLDDSQYTSVRLLDGQLQSRHGVARLAHVMGLQLVPVFSYRLAPDQVVVEILDPIEAGGDKAQYMAEATARMWHSFTPYFEKFPAQWASIGHCYRFRELSGNAPDQPFDPTQDYLFNDDRFVFFDEEQPILFDLHHLEPIGMPQGYATLLRKIQNNKLSVPGAVLRSVIKNDDAIAMLTKSAVLIKALSTPNRAQK